MIEINELIKSAMKEKNAIKLSLYRNIKTKISKLLTAKNSDHIATEDIVLSAIKSELKEINEELKYLNVGDSTHYKSLSLQKTYIENLLPKELSIDQINKLVVEAIREVGLNFGSVMKYLKSLNLNINMKIASEIVKRNMEP